MFADFVGVSMDQIFNQMAKFRYMFGGKTRCPAVVRLAMGAGMNMGAQHSQTMYAMLTAVPGLKVVVPSNAYDAKGLLIQAIRDDDPVMFFEHKALYPRKGEVPDGAYTIPFGEANLLREGEHVTVVAIGRMVVFAEKVIDTLAKEGITCDLIDPRTTSPLDEETILESVSSTGRLVVVDESNPRCSIASEICAIVAEKGFRSLKAAPRIGHRPTYARAFCTRTRARLCAGPRPDRSGHPGSDGGVKKDMHQPIRGSPRLAGLAFATLLVGRLAFGAATAGDPKVVSPVDDPTFQNKAPSATPHAGEEVFVKSCAQCHLGQVPRAPHKMFLQMMPADMIFAALDAGAMRSQAAETDQGTKARGGSYLGGDKPALAAAAPKCSGRAALFDTRLAPAASGWGITADNHRYIDEQTAGLQAADLPRLELKWAFAFPNAQRARSQPAIAYGAVYVGSQDGTVYALDVDTGCVRWTYRASAEVRTAIVVEAPEAARARNGRLAFFSATCWRGSTRSMRSQGRWCGSTRQTIIRTRRSRPRRRCTMARCMCRFLHSR